MNPSASLKDKFVSSARWTLAIRVMDRGLGFASTLILARLLTPEDFGVIAMGTSIMAILLSITEFGFSQALIQRADVEREAYDTAWTLLIIANAIAALTLMALIPSAVRWYGDERVAPVMVCLAFLAFLSSFRNVGLVLFERDMEFRPAFLTALARKVASVTVGAGAALVLRSYWALLAGVLAGVLAELAGSYRLSPYRPRFSLSRTRELMSFSKWWLGAQFIGLASRRGQEFFVGGQLGAQPLGQYSIAYEFATLPTTEIVAPVTRAVLPGYMKLRTDAVRMFAAFTRVWGAVALVALPAAAGIFSLSAPITQVVLGPKWVGTETLLGLLALLGASQALTSSFWPLILTLKGPEGVFVLSIVGFALVLPPFAALLSLYGLQVAVLGLLVANVTLLALVAGWLVRSEGWNGMTLVRALVRPAIATLLMVAALRAFVPLLSFAGSWAAHALSLLVAIAFGASVYAGGIAALWLVAGRPSGAERDVLEMLPLPGRFRFWN